MLSIDFLISFVATAILLVITVFFGNVLSYEFALWAHIISFLALGFLYELPEFVLDIFTLGRFRNVQKVIEGWDLLRLIIQMRYALTHITGTLFGVMTVWTGFYLVFTAFHSLTEGWLFWIVGAASIYVAKGLFHHNIYLRRLQALVLQGEGARDHNAIVRFIRNPFDVALNPLELPGYIFILLSDYFKPQWVVPGRKFFEYMEGWPNGNITAGLLYFGIVFLITLIVLRWAMNKWNVIVYK